MYKQIYPRTKPLTDLPLANQLIVNPHSLNQKKSLSQFIDDICIDEACHYSCILCNYIVISPYNTCVHKYCDYCLTKLNGCLICNYLKLPLHKTYVYNYCDYCLIESTMCIFCKTNRPKPKK